MRWGPLASSVAVALFLGCGDDDAPGGADAAVDAGSGVAEPAPPAPVTMAPCPTGWREVVEGSVVLCDPWPEGGPSECADDEAHFVGEPGCSRIGTECPADGLPVVPDGVTAVYVLAEAAPGGDGSRASPFQRFTDASVSSRRPGTVIALGRGTYEGRMLLPDGVTLRGACVAETRITAPSALESEPTIFVTRGAATVANLTLVDTGGPGLIANGAGVSLTVEDVVVRRSRIGGLIALAQSTVSAENVLVDEPQPRSVGTLGRGVNVEGGAGATLARVVVRGSTDIAVYAGGAGTLLSASDLAVLDTREENGRGGRGVNVDTGAVGTLERAAIHESHQAGIYVGLDGASLVADHVVVRDTHAQSRDGQNGEGLLVELGGRVEATSIWIERSDEIGVFARDPGSTLELSDVVVRDTFGTTPPGGSGVAVAFYEGARGTARRLLVERARTIGLFAQDGSDVSLEDVTVRDILPNAATDTFGRGMDASSATLRVRRALVERAHEIGVMVMGEAATFDAEDIVVRDTASTPTAGELGMSLVAQIGGAAIVTRGVFERSHAGGVFAIGLGTRAELSEVIIRDVMRPPCAETSSCELPVALGLASVGMAVVRASGFEVTSAGDCGIQLSGNANLDLDDGVIASNAIGACVQQDGYDLSRLSTNVRYAENGTNLDATTLPVPTPAAAAGSPVP